MAGLGFGNTNNNIKLGTIHSPFVGYVLLRGFRSQESNFCPAHLMISLDFTGYLVRIDKIILVKRPCC